MVLVTAQAEVDFCYLCAALDFVVTSAAVESSAAAASDESSGAKKFRSARKCALSCENAALTAKAWLLLSIPNLIGLLVCYWTDFDG